jgi:hypothetical protein
VRRIFKGFEVVSHDIQTPLAGHDIYLLRRGGDRDALVTP